VHSRELEINQLVEKKIIFFDYFINSVFIFFEQSANRCFSKDSDRSEEETYIVLLGIILFARKLFFDIKYSVKSTDRRSLVLEN